jgi:hypothetical protein
MYFGYQRPSGPTRVSHSGRRLAQAHTLVERFRLIGQGTIPDEFLDGLFHLTINSNGEVTVEKVEFRAACK